MKRRFGAPSGLQALSEARPGLRDNLSDWFKARLRPDIVDEPRHPLQTSAAPSTLVAPSSPAVSPSAQELLPPQATPEARARRVVVLGAPHPISRRLFKDIAEILADREPDAEPLQVSYLTASRDAEAQAADVFIYLRSDCAGGSRLLAALEPPGETRLGPATRTVTHLDDWYWSRPNLAVERALLERDYLPARLEALLGMTLGAAALQRANAAFEARAALAGPGADLLSYLGQVEGCSPPLPPPSRSDRSEPNLLAQTLAACASAPILLVSAEPGRATDELASSLGTLAVEHGAPDAILERAPKGADLLQAACLHDMAGHADIPRIVAKLESERWVLCGEEASADAVRRLCTRCLDAGVGHNLSFVFEDRRWKAFPRAMFEG